MLSKLLGYEMKAYSRIMLPIYAALIAFSFGIGFCLRFLPERAMNSVLFVFALILYVLLFAAVVFVTFVMVILRFYNNVLGREGYFMMSLPVKTNTMLIAKILSAFIWIVIGTVLGLAAALSTTLIAHRGELISLEQLRTVLRMIGEAASRHPFLVILTILIVIVSAFARVMRIYASASIGSRWNGHRLIGSILTYIVFVIIEVVALNFLNSIDGIRQLVERADVSKPGFLVFILALVIFEYAVYHLLTWFSVDRRLNLE